MVGPIIGIYDLQVIVLPKMIHSVSQAGPQVDLRKRVRDRIHGGWIAQK